MRAARLHELGGTPRLDEVDPPAATEGPIRITTAALNPVDISIANGRFYGGTPDFPYVIGSEAVGAAADGSRLWVRDRGTMAESVVPGSGWRFAIPDGVDDAQALACGIAGLTGWLAVSWRARVEPGDVVLVLGASGTVGATAVQAAKLLGATVIGAARRTENIPPIADEVVALGDGGELPAADVIIDGLWGEPVERALAAARRGVRVVQLGQSAGSDATLRSDWVRGNDASIVGFGVYSTPEEIGREGYRVLCEHVREGRIVHEVESYPLEAIAEAWKRQVSGSPSAKIVVDLS